MRAKFCPSPWATAAPPVRQIIGDSQTEPLCCDETGMALRPHPYLCDEVRGCSFRLLCASTVRNVSSSKTFLPVLGFQKSTDTHSAVKTGNSHFSGNSRSFHAPTYRNSSQADQFLRRRVRPSRPTPRRAIVAGSGMKNASEWAKISAGVRAAS